jgi:hypothetical protein
MTIYTRRTEAPYLMPETWTAEHFNVASSWPDGVVEQTGVGYVFTDSDGYSAPIQNGDYIVLDRKDGTRTVCSAWLFESMYEPLPPIRA